MGSTSASKSRRFRFVFPLASLIAIIAAVVAWRFFPFQRQLPAYEWRDAKFAMTPIEARAIWGHPTRVEMIDRAEVWSYGVHGLAGISFKDGECIQSNMGYYIAPNGARLPVINVEATVVYTHNGLTTTWHHDPRR